MIVEIIREELLLITIGLSNNQPLTKIPKNWTWVFPRVSKAYLHYRPILTSTTHPRRSSNQWLFFLVRLRSAVLAQQTSRECYQKGLDYTQKDSRTGLKGVCVLSSFGAGQIRGQAASMKVSKGLGPGRLLLTPAKSQRSGTPFTSCRHMWWLGWLVQALGRV